jgi:hypothetical protein
LSPASGFGLARRPTTSRSCSRPAPWRAPRDGERPRPRLGPELAAALQARLDRGIRHWSVRLEARGGALRRNVEVVDGDAGIWRVRSVGDRVELAPATSTDVLRALVEQVAHAGVPLSR